jgi:hypothetical protein
MNDVQLRLIGLAVTGLLVWITEYYTGTKYRPVHSDRESLDHRSRHQRHPGPRHLDGIDGASGGRHLCGASSLPTCNAGLFGIAHRRDLHAGACRHDRCARRLWSGHRQRRRHCRNVGPAEGSPQTPTRSTPSATPRRPSPRAMPSVPPVWRAGALRGLHRRPEAYFPRSSM